MENKFKPQQEVFLTVYTKEDPNAFYICKGLILRVPENGVRQYYKVKIVAVSDQPVNKQRPQMVLSHTKFLGTTMSKSEADLTLNLPKFMEPKKWITMLST